jgi:site-specific DNA recombinase
MTTRTAIYVRVSTDEQVSGYGLDVQRERCRAQAVAKGWSLAAEYTDEGISGTKDASGRPGLAEMLASARAGQLDAVIVLALDRLGRKTRIVLDLVDELARAGVALVSCKESLDTSTPQGQFVLTMFAALAQLERDTIVERTTAGRNARGQRDGDRGGRLPYGYTRGDSGPVVEPAAADQVRTIFALRAQGLALRAIADQLDAEPPYGVRWYASSVREVLQNESAYRGNTRGASAVCWPAIL